MRDKGVLLAGPSERSSAFHTQKRTGAIQFHALYTPSLLKSRPAKGRSSRARIWRAWARMGVTCGVGVAWTLDGGGLETLGVIARRLCRHLVQIILFTETATFRVMLI